MMKIAICDDEKEFRDLIRVYIEDYLNTKDILYTIDTFISGEKFLNETFPSEYSIIFLDINMEGMDGITTAKKIRERGINSYIVFVTAYIDYSLEGYKVGAVRYLLKNGYNLQVAMEECLDAILEKKRENNARKKFPFKEGQTEVLFAQILYIESKLHKWKFHILENEKIRIYTMYGTMNELEEELELYHFVRVHQSYLVNLQYIRQVSRYKVTLYDDETISIPKARYKEVQAVFVAYKGEI